MAGSLVIVGTGLSAAAHMTLETKSLIEQAEKVLYVVADPVTAQWLETLNSTAESLYHLYDPAIERLQTYLRMTDCIMASVRAGKRVCAVFYGHPGVFVFPAHEAIITATAEGYPAEMRPAVSAEDCLFADLRIDPGRVGCQSFEATDFLIHDRIFDPRSILVLWQIGVVGQIGFQKTFPIAENLAFLKARLARHYPPDHVGFVYEASPYPVCDPVIEPVAIADLRPEQLTPISTFVLPPAEPSLPNLETMAALAIPETYLRTKQENPSRYDPQRPCVTPSLRA